MNAVFAALLLFPLVQEVPLRPQVMPRQEIALGRQRDAVPQLPRTESAKARSVRISPDESSRRRSSARPFGNRGASCRRKSESRSARKRSPI